MSQGYTASGDPEAWSIVNGKLYLNYSKSVMKTWLEAPRDYGVAPSTLAYRADNPPRG